MLRGGEGKGWGESGCGGDARVGSRSKWERRKRGWGLVGVGAQCGAAGPIHHGRVHQGSRRGVQQARALCLRSRPLARQDGRPASLSHQDRARHQLGRFGSNWWPKLWSKLGELVSSILERKRIDSPLTN